MPLATRREPVECPHCGEPTMPNLLADGSLVCSCAAERALTAPSPPLAPRPAPPK
jgi:formylmethanofuran dehydrogenase subunit E